MSEVEWQLNTKLFDEGNSQIIESNKQTCYNSTKKTASVCLNQTFSNEIRIHHLKLCLFHNKYQFAYGYNNFRISLICTKSTSDNVDISFKPIVRRQTVELLINFTCKKFVLRTLTDGRLSELHQAIITSNDSHKLSIELMEEQGAEIISYRNFENQNMCESIEFIKFETDIDQKVLLYQQAIDKFDDIEKHKSSLQEAYFFCANYFKDKQYKKAFAYLLKIKNVNSIKLRNVIIQSIKEYIQNDNDTSDTTDKDFQTAIILFQKLPDRIIKQNSFDLQRFIMKIVNYPVSIHQKSHNPQLISLLSKCYEFNLGYFYAKKQFDAACQCYLKLRELNTVITIKHIQGIQDIAGSIIKYLIELKQEQDTKPKWAKRSALISGYINSLAHNNIGETIPIELIDLIALFYGFKDLQIVILFEILTDQSIKKHKLHSYAAQRIHKNDIKKALKYCKMEQNDGEKLILYEWMVKKFGYDKSNDKLLKTYYELQLKYLYGKGQFIGSEQSFAYYLKLFDLRGMSQMKKIPQIQRIAGGLAQYCYNLKEESLVIGYIRQLYHSKKWLNSTSEIVLLYFGNKQFRMNMLIHLLTDETIRKYQLHLYAAQELCNNDILSALKYYKMEKDSDQKLILYQWIIDKFDNNFDKRLTECYEFCLNYFETKQQYEKAFGYYMKLMEIQKDLFSFNKLRNMQNISGSLAKYYEELKETSLITGYINCYYKRCYPINELIDTIVSYFGTKQFKMRLFFKLLSKQTIIKYKLHLYAAQVMYKDDIEKVLTYCTAEQDEDKKFDLYQWIITKFGHDNRNDTILKCCYIFCFSYFAQNMKQYERAFEYYMKINDIETITQIKLIPNIQNIVGTLAMYYKRLDEKSLIFGYVHMHILHIHQQPYHINELIYTIISYFGTYQFKMELFCNVLSLSVNNAPNFETYYHFLYYQKQLPLPIFEKKVEACVEAEKILKEAMAALRFEHVNTAIKKAEEAIDVLQPHNI